MKKISQLVLTCLSVLPFTAHAAGTYYTGGYQSPQQNYGKTYQTSGYSSARANTNYNTSNRNSSVNPYYQSRNSSVANQSSGNTNQNTGNKKQGLYLNAGIAKETAQWGFEMDKSGSILHYDNLSWNVFDIGGEYNIATSQTPIVIDANLKIGMQSGETTMVDDDITNGGYLITTWVDGSDNLIGDEMGHALSVGKTSGGSMLGFNIGFGLSDFFKIGNMKMTPSVGYRYLNYTLDTKSNNGLSVDTTACFDVGGGEIQCDPTTIFVYSDGSQGIVWRDDATGVINVDTTAVSIDTAGTYYYKQPGTSHSYEVSWAGPYLAMDMDYTMNQYNAVNARVELGFPGYEAIGDQPYRYDWQHPKSVEDSASMGSAMHLGLAANWQTAMTNSVMLSFGFTYDYYSVSGAQAKTYLNGDYYNTIYNILLAQWQTAGFTEADMINTTTGDPTALYILDLQESCPGWVCKQDDEISSLYKSMGIRVGLSAKF